MALPAHTGEKHGDRTEERSAPAAWRYRERVTRVHWSVYPFHERIPLAQEGFNFVPSIDRFKRIVGSQFQNPVLHCQEYDELFVCDRCWF
jgi:hypothetical protein